VSGHPNLPGNIDPLIGDWFLSRFAAPTPVQAGVWERLARGDDVLAEAPTGNGKTLAAFLVALSRLASGEYEQGRLSVLYISPLKALNEDVRRNLLDPIAEISAFAGERGGSFPPITVETRSGDTPESARRRFLTRPPSILCSTPESFAILLDSPRARGVLSSVRLVVADEIHALIGNKRGALFASSLGRLAFLSGEYQRVALSATLRSAGKVAAWFGGRRLEGVAGESARHVPRPVVSVAPRVEKQIEFSVSWPRSETAAKDREEAAFSPSKAGGPRAGLRGATNASRYDAIVPAILDRMASSRTTMIFCDSRRRAERLAFLLNEEAAERGAGEAVAWAHHGSLSREVREAVEGRLKAGELSAVVATGSLELGIDVGEVDRVILAGAPPTIAQAVQRGGRSGHGVGRISVVEIMPFHGLELLVAAATVREARRGGLEEARPPSNPLDILAQVLLSLAAEEPRRPDALYDIVTCFSPFADLPRPLFDSTLELLRGRWSPADGGAGPRELRARVFLDPADGLVHAAEGARALLWTAGGAIPDRGLYTLRLSGEGRRIGELDEEFVFERKVGDAFTFGSQSWRIVGIGAEAVDVLPLDRKADFVPFWKGGPLYWSPELAEGVLDLVDRIGQSGETDIRSLLVDECRFSSEACDELCDFVASQRDAQARIPLPGRNRVVVERIGGEHSEAATTVLIHSFRGGRINEGLAFLLEAALSETAEPRAQVHADNEGVLVLASPGSGAADLSERLVALLGSFGDPGRIEALSRAGLEGSGLFASAFRENAGRALLLPRGFARRRQPLWLSRLRAARLFDSVRGRADFPITLETWRSVLVDTIDMRGLEDFLGGLATGRIEIATFDANRPSPFASGAAWAADAEFMYRGDDIRGGAASVSADAIALAMKSPDNRPLIDPALVAQFVRKKKRLLPGWAPDNVPELAAWIDERVAVTAEELIELAAAGGLSEEIARDRTAGGRLETFRLTGASIEIVATASRREELSENPGDCLAEWLRFEGPVRAPEVEAFFGIAPLEFAALIGALEEEGAIVKGLLVRDRGESVVDRENYEILLRMSRSASRPAVKSRPGSDLFRLVAARQGFVGGRDDAVQSTAFAETLGRLAGYPAPVEIWRDSILPSRLGPEWLAGVDRCLKDEGWLWFGTGRESIAFADAWNYELFARTGEASALLSAEAGPLDFWSIKTKDGRASKEVALAMWAEAWEGRIASDSFTSVLDGERNGFGRKLPNDAGRDELLSRRQRHRALPPSFRHRWRNGAPVDGRWSSIVLEEGGTDALDEEELDRERVRVLARRYGVLVKPLLEKELGPLSWSRLFPCMRRMELAGELLSGLFFEDTPAPQFIGPEAFSAFRELDELDDDRPIWMSSLDPASPAGIPDGSSGLAVPRSASASLCLWRGRIVAASRRSGRALEIDAGAGAERLELIVDAWSDSVGRVRLETVDGAPAADSAIASLLSDRGFEADRGSLRRWE